MRNNEIFNKIISAGKGLLFSDSSDTMSYNIQNEINSPYQFQHTSTNFNNRDRYSLEKLKINKLKLKSFKELNQNWNGYNGIAFSEALLMKVEKILANLEYQPQVFPTGRGTVQLEKYLHESNQIEIEISAEEIFMYKIKNGKETEKEISESEINYHISEIYG